MATTDLADRAEATAAELSAAARRHFTDAEQSARRAAEAAQDAAEVYAARASEAAHEAAERLGDRAQHAATTIRHEATELRDDVEDLWEDPDSRRLLLGIGIGAALIALAAWILRRRRRADHYESSDAGVAGWEDPKQVFDAEPTDDVAAEEADTEDAEA